jgi:hypothetical protein
MMRHILNLLKQILELSNSDWLQRNQGIALELVFRLPWRIQTKCKWFKWVSTFVLWWDLCSKIATVMSSQFIHSFDIFRENFVFCYHQTKWVSQWRFVKSNLASILTSGNSKQIFMQKIWNVDALRQLWTFTIQSNIQFERTSAKHSQHNSAELKHSHTTHNWGCLNLEHSDQPKMQFRFSEFWIPTFEWHLFALSSLLRVQSFWIHENKIHLE